MEGIFCEGSCYSSLFPDFADLLINDIRFLKLLGNLEYRPDPTHCALSDFDENKLRILLAIIYYAIE